MSAYKGFITCENLGMNFRKYEANPMNCLNCVAAVGTGKELKVCILPGLGRTSSL